MVNMASEQKKTLYIGSFVHSISLQQLEYCEEALIGVDERGVIAFVDRGTTSTSKPGWQDAHKVQLPKNAFLFPGFIGIDNIS